MRPLPSLLPSEVYFLEDFELNLSLFLQDGVGEFGALSPTIPYLLQGPLGNVKVWLPLMWGGDSPSTGSSFRCLVVLPGYVCVWRGKVGKSHQVGVPWEDWSFCPTLGGLKARLGSRAVPRPVCCCH